VSWLVLHLYLSVAIVPPHLPRAEVSKPPLAVIPVLSRRVSFLLIGIVAGTLAVFGIAARLNPYEDDGTPRTMGTHVQTGLPPCTFKVMTGVPCPSCGLTTSFALLVRGDIVNSLRANAVGTALALFWLALIPWSLACTIGRRYFLITTPERALFVAVIGFVGLLIIRWAIILGMGWWNGTYFRF